MQKLQNFCLKIVFITSLLITISACYREPEFPEALLNMQKMTDLLTDIHLAEAKIAGMGTLSQTQRDSLMEIYYSTIFKIHAVNADDFDQSMDAYMKNPKALAAIYEKVLEKLQKEPVEKKAINIDSIKQKSPKQ